MRPSRQNLAIFTVGVNPGSDAQGDTVRRRHFHGQLGTLTNGIHVHCDIGIAVGAFNAQMLLVAVNACLQEVSYLAHSRSDFAVLEVPHSRRTKRESCRHDACNAEPGDHMSVTPSDSVRAPTELVEVRRVHDRCPAVEDMWSF